MSLVQTTTHGDMIQVDQAAVLTAIGLNPRDPKSQAVVLVCDRYNLDPILKHVILIQGAVYITRDGLLHIAHSSGKFDGIEVVDEGETQSHWTAKVSVWRKDFGRPVTYSGRYPKNGSNKAHGPEMAIARAESMALRRAFAVAGLPSRDEVFDPDTAIEADSEPLADERSREALKARLNALDGKTRGEFRVQFGLPMDLPASKVDAAAVWVSQRESSQSSPPAESAELGPSQEPPPRTAPSADNSVQARKKRAQRIHIAASELEPTVLDVLIFGTTGGQSDSANDVTDGQVAGLLARIDQAKRGDLPDDYPQVADRWLAWKDGDDEATDRALAQYEADMNEGGNQ